MTLDPTVSRDDGEELLLCVPLILGNDLDDGYTAVDLPPLFADDSDPLMPVEEFPLARAIAPSNARDDKSLLGDRLLELVILRHPERFKPALELLDLVDRHPVQLALGVTFDRDHRIARTNI